jgi:hypothetical protein
LSSLTDQHREASRYRHQQIADRIDDRHRDVDGQTRGRDVESRTLRARDTRDCPKSRQRAPRRLREGRLDVFVHRHEHRRQIPSRHVTFGSRECESGIFTRASRLQSCSPRPGVYNSPNLAPAGREKRGAQRNHGGQARKPAHHNRSGSIGCLHAPDDLAKRGAGLNRRSNPRMGRDLNVSRDTVWESTARSLRFSTRGHMLAQLGTSTPSPVPELIMPTRQGNGCGLFSYKLHIVADEGHEPNPADQHCTPRCVRYPRSGIDERECRSKHHSTTHQNNASIRQLFTPPDK